MSNVKKVPTFVINGFLEAGKTTFIRNAIIGDPKLKKETILVICCEEGEVEYEPLPKNVIIHTLEDKDELEEDLFIRLNEKYKPSYVLIEYNGVWGMQSLYSTKLPGNWVLVDQMTIIDATTFESYFNNMKSIFADMLRSSTVVILKRCTRDDDFKLYRDSIRPCALQADIMYMNDDEGIMDVMLEDELPYSLDSDEIVLTDETFVIWYIDMLDNIDRYMGKTVEFTALVAKPPYFRPNVFHAGNMIMTCCEDDMQFFGFVCEYDKAGELEEGRYVKVKAQIGFDFAPEYEEDGPVLYAKSVEVLPMPKKDK